MIYHVLPGDSLVREFKGSGIDGEMIICREAFVMGPIDADELDTFWNERAAFILAENGEDEMDYHEFVADELMKLTDAGTGDEVNLWFEYELFCNVNLWCCMWLMRQSKAKLFRVFPIIDHDGGPWIGFGRHTAADVVRCFSDRVKLARDDITLGLELWEAFRKNDKSRLDQLSSNQSITFPYLKEVCEAAIERETRPAEIIAEIQFEGKTEFEDIFPEFVRRAGVYGFGDLQVKQIIERANAKF